MILFDKVLYLVSVSLQSLIVPVNVLYHLIIYRAFPHINITVHCQGCLHVWNWDVLVFCFFIFFLFDCFHLVWVEFDV